MSALRPLLTTWNYTLDASPRKNGRHTCHMDDNTKPETPPANERTEGAPEDEAVDDEQELDEDDDGSEDDGDGSDEDDGADDALGETKRYRVPRTGDRDIIFTGKLIGTGNHHFGYDNEYEAQIFATEGGKFIATRWHTLNNSTTYLAQVCESAETVAAFFHITPPTPEVKRGQRADPPVPYLCEDGKKAIEGAASFFDDFEVLYLEEVE
jgi:hypothetical protein